jgi:hypothetical protein
MACQVSACGYIVAQSKNKSLMSVRAHGSENSSIFRANVITVTCFSHTSEQEIMLMLFNKFQFYSLNLYISIFCIRPAYTRITLEVS